jgi:peptide deformylase
MASCLVNAPSTLRKVQDTSPRADITIGTTCLSLKTETGNITRRKLISITKLCTTETGEWTSEALIGHALSHLSRYEGILMLRAIGSE